MKSSTILLLGLLISTISLSLIPGSTWAATKFSGDANQDDAIDIADVITLIDINDSGIELTAEEQVFSDANQDGLVDPADVDYVVDVILGRRQALSIIRPAAMIVSYWRPESSSEASQMETAILPARASFWIKAGALESIGENDILPAAASYWFNDDEPRAINENDVHPPQASFWMMGEEPEIIEENADQLGTPSFERQ